MWYAPTKAFIPPQCQHLINSGAIYDVNNTDNSVSAAAVNVWGVRREGQKYVSYPK